MLSKEEKDGTAEFLLTHPVSRVRVLTEKLLAVLIQITVLNLVIYGVSAASMLAVGEDVPWKELNLLHLAYYLMQIELGAICFGISAFMKRGSMGAGIGVAAMMYTVNLLANITESVEFLKYVTPFGYCDGADVVTNGELDAVFVTIGMAIAVAGIAAAFVRYTKKDMH
jgi:ABC-2 type transport system permease protein